MLKYLTDLKPTKEWAEHNLTEKQIPEAWVLYHETDKGLVFAGFHNPDIPDEDYADGIAAVLMQSVYQNTGYLAAGTRLRNVAGSADDVLKDRNGHIVDGHPNWISVWAICCMNNGITPVRKCYVSNNDRGCNGVICGGHLQIENNPSIYVYIVPICSSHNNYNGVMTLSEDTPVVAMLYEIPNRL